MDSSAKPAASVLRPIEQMAFRTFALALALFRMKPEGFALEAMDQFLSQNKAVLLLPRPFHAPAGSATDIKEVKAVKEVKEVMLRGVVYPGITSDDVKIASKVSALLEIERNEALRVIVQTKQRFPEILDYTTKKSTMLSRLPDDSAHNVEKSRVQMYVNAVLAERNTISCLLVECFNVRYDEKASYLARSIGTEVVTGDEYIHSAIDALDTFLSSSELASENEFHKAIAVETLFRISQMLKFVYEVILSRGTSHKETVRKWFTVMSKTSFVITINSKVPERQSFLFLQALCTVISLQLLQLKHDFAEQIPDLYLDDPQTFKLVNQIISSNSAPNILKYLWLLMSHKKSIILEEYNLRNSEFLQVVTLEDTQAALSKLLRSLQHDSVFLEIASLRQTLSFDDIFSVTLSHLLLLAMPLVNVTEEVARCLREVLGSAPAFCIEQFFSDSEAIRSITLARAKFPSSLSPFLCFAAINGHFGYDELCNMKSYMANLPVPITDYEIDSDNTDLIRLTTSLDVYPPYEGKHKLGLSLEAGTKAKVITVQGQNIVLFLHQYNGWAFLGRVIENISKSFDLYNEEKIMLLSDAFSLLGRVCEQISVAETAHLLDAMSAYIDDSDIVDVIFRVFEQVLHQRCMNLAEEIMLLLVTLVPIIPQRIWAFLAVSSLLSHDGKEGLLLVLFDSVESKRGSYGFTISAVKFVSALADNCLVQSTDYPEKAKSDILARFVCHLTLVLESSVNCKFVDGLQKLELGLLTVNVFRHMIEAIFCIGADIPASKKPTRVFSDAADCILEAFLDTDAKATSSSQLIFQLIDCLARQKAVFESRDPSSFLLELWIDSALSFARLLVTVRHTQSTRVSSFEKQIFTKLPEMVIIYAQNGPHRKPILDLLAALMTGARNDSSAPSMLSHLGPESAKTLLASLATDLSHTFDDYSIKISIYDFLCAMMEANQHGLSVLLISGHNVFGSSNDASGLISLLSVLKKNVHEIADYPDSVSVHLLDAIAFAFNSWTTARDNDLDIMFVSNLVLVMSNFQKARATNGEFDLTQTTYRCKVISKIAEILSFILFTTKNEKCENLLIDLLTSKSFLDVLPLVFSVTDYDSQSYEETHVRFEALFPPYKLTQFTNAIQKRNRFGAGAVYNLQIMDSFFGKQAEWAPLRQEIVSCSANTQYYTVQLALQKAFGALVTAFCRRTPKSLMFAYFDLVPQLLTERDPVDPFTLQYVDQQHYERVELAFLLSYSVNSAHVEKSPRTAFNILGACIENLRTTSTEDSRQADSRKALLRISFLALSNLKNSSDLVSTNFRIFEEFFEYVIARGTTNVVIELQNNVYLIRTKKKFSDLSGKLDLLRLIFSTLKVILSFRMVPAVRQKLLETLPKHGTTDTLRSLYSFSHLLLVNDEPVFAQMSLMFTQQLMMSDEFSGNFVDSRLFIVIRESVISQSLREGGINIENAPQLHQVWTNGILPILVTCLAKIQHVNEVLLTLLTFSKQIESCIDLWLKDSASLKVSTACVIETAQIIYIYRLLCTVTQKQELDSGSASELDMPYVPGLDTRQKRDDFANYISNLLKHPKFLVSRIVPSSAEEKVLQSNEKGYHAFVENLIDEIGSLKEFIA